jgi:hypothetical protein
MWKSLIVIAVLLFAAQIAVAQEEDQQPPDAVQAEETNETQQSEESEEPQGNGVDQPKTMSGMSILGNEEAPKSLVIIPWKSSEIGSDRDLVNSLDDRAEPVDKDVFLRQLRYYEIRAGQ